MELLDLPLELFEAIVSEMMIVVGFSQANELRTVNKVFDKTVIKIAFTEQNANYLVSGWLTIPSLKAIFTNALQQKLENNLFRESSISATIYNALDVLESLHAFLSSESSNERARREEYLNTLCESVIDHVQLKTIINECSNPEQQPECALLGALTAASAAGNLGLINQLINKGADVTQESKFFLSPMDSAARYGQLDALKLLLQHGVPSDTSVFQACYAGKDDVVNFLLDTNLGLKSNTIYLDRMIYNALRGGHFSTVQTLIARVDEPDRPSLRQKAFFSFVAQTSGNSIHIVNVLLDAGVQIDALNILGDTAIEIACLVGNVQMAKLLFDRGFDQTPSLLATSLVFAAQEGHVDFVELLLDRGVDINASRMRPTRTRRKSKPGLQSCRTALFSAIVMGELHTMRFLLDRGADVHHKDASKVVGVACHGANDSLRQLLVDIGVDIGKCKYIQDDPSHKCSWD